MAKFIGLIIHFIYWSVFANFNELPIDSYHKTLIFLTIQKVLSELSAKYKTRKMYTTLSMPMIVLSIRIIIDGIFRSNYPQVFESSSAGRTVENNVTLLITKLLDPNVLYSRFSYLESEDNAIRLKLKQRSLSKAHQVQDMFYTNSSLVNSLLVRKSEGKVRRRFTAMPTRAAPRQSKLNATHGEQMTAANYATSGNKEFKGCLSSKSWVTVVEDKALEMSNSIQMCNVAFKQVNQSLYKHNLSPVFNLLDIK